MPISPYERRLILSYLSNAFSHLRSRDQDAKSLLLWIRKHEDQLDLPYPLQADGDADGVKRHRFSRVLQALSDALAKAGKVRPDRTARRLRLLARATRLSRTDVAILELVMRYQAGTLVESIIDDVTRSRHWGRTFRVGNPVLPRLLGLSAGAVYRRFASDAPLVTSGLVSIDDDGDVTLVDRLKRLYWLPKDAGSGVQSLLLDEAGPAELRWSDFDHVAGDRDHLERLLTGALKCGQKGVNILIHGMPGTGKTEFCKTLAARLGAPLYSVGESDDSGGEPSRHERMQELRLAQRLLAGDRRSILLFDEMEDLLSGPQGMLAALFGSSRSRGRSAGRLEGVHEPPPGRDSGAGPVDLELGAVDQSRSLAPYDVCAWNCGNLRPGSGSGSGRDTWRTMGSSRPRRTLEPLAREFDVTPGVASGVTAAARLGGGTIVDVRRGVQGLAYGVLSGDAPPTQRTPERYDPALIRADVDPVELADRLVEGASSRHFSLCLQGPPGTGKSAFARHCGRPAWSGGRPEACIGSHVDVGRGNRKGDRRRLHRGAGRRGVPGVRRGRFAAGGPAPGPEELGGQPSQRDADLDGKPPASLRLHDELSASGWTRRPCGGSPSRSRSTTCRPSRQGPGSVHISGLRLRPRSPACRH